jgi:hypothetical protein
MKMFKDFLERYKAAGFTRVPFMRPKTTEDGNSDGEEEEDEEAVIMPRRSQRPRLLTTDSGQYLECFCYEKTFWLIFKYNFLKKYILDQHIFHLFKLLLLNIEQSNEPQSTAGDNPGEEDGVAIEEGGGARSGEENATEYEDEAILLPRRSKRLRRLRTDSGKLL